MESKELIPHLFRTEFRKIVSVLSKLFGLDYMEVAEDIVSDTFLLATETWSMKGIPENPKAWLYLVAKNKTKDYLRRNKLFAQKISIEIQSQSNISEELEIDLSNENIADSQLRMIFALCNPCIPKDAQIGLSLRILCGFGIGEIADAFLTQKETIQKRLFRAKEKLKEEGISLSIPEISNLPERLKSVLTTLYLLFNEGYHSSTPNKTLRKDLCLEAIRLTFLLTENSKTKTPDVFALLALMCFHSSRFEARIASDGELILYQFQDRNLWDKNLIQQGEYFLNRSAKGFQLSRFHLEAGIAYWHTVEEDSKEKWPKILEYYNVLLQIEYSPSAALNRTFALGKVHGYHKAAEEAEKLKLTQHPFYFCLLGELYSNINVEKALINFNSALSSSKNERDRTFFKTKIANLGNASGKILI